MTSRDLPNVGASADWLLQRAGAELPALALLLGSGWAALAERMTVSARIGYGELPSFPAPGVAGHAGEVLVGTLAGVPLLLLSGRKHAYEDGDAAAMKGAIRTLAAAGVRALLLTNAAGSLEPALPPGRLMLLSDHLNLAQRTPLLCEPGDARFVDMADAYCPRLRQQALAAARSIGLPLREGVYAWMLGPQFETPAEIRMLQQLGANAVGMSTVPETIVARQAGLRVLALSMITNMGCGLSDESLSHANTLAGAQAASADAVRLIERLLPTLEI